MQQSKIPGYDEELTLVYGELQVIKDLLDIFYLWYDDSHKASNIDRSYTSADISGMWDNAPKYLSQLHTALVHVGQLQKEVDEVIDARIAQEAHA